MLRAGLAAAATLYGATTACATFHISHIQRLMTGVDGSSDVQFVEIQMDFAGQNLVSGTKLIAFKADGTFDHVVLTVPTKVTNGINGRSWIMASSAFAAKAGLTPEFTFDSSPGKGLPTENGMVCWGLPSDQTNPNSVNMIDCVSYGNFTGAANIHTSAPSALRPYGHGLVRSSSTSSSAADFTCEDPSLPHNNTTAAGSIAASSPCTGCGNGTVDGQETCDDGNPLFTAGDFCSAACVAFPCGIPTKANGASPKTSDALFVLKAAVQQSNCDLRVCDVNNSTTVNTSDALLILKSAVGQPVTLHCPAP